MSTEMQTYSATIIDTLHFFLIVLLHSMIGYWHDTIVCLSVCDAVHCDTWGDVGNESCTVVFLPWHFLFTSLDTFAVEWIV